jgi:hypothetical protein
VKAVAGEFVRWDVVAEVPGLGDLDQEVTDQVDDLLPGLGDVFFLVQEGHDIGAVVLTVRADTCIGMEHRFEPVAWIAGSTQLASRPPILLRCRDG